MELKENTRPEVTGATIAGRLSGAAGLILLASTVLTYMLTEQVGVLVIGKLVVGLALVVTYLFTNAEFWRQLAGGRSTGLLAMSLTAALIVVGLVGAANYVVVKHDHEFDLTREGVYTLSEQTTKILARLKTDVKALAFYASYEQEYPAIKETLARYAKESSRFTYEIVDPQLRVDLVEKYEVKSRGPRLVFVAGDKDARVKELSEEELTHALIKVSASGSAKIGFLTGHGEPNGNDEKDPAGYKQIMDAVRSDGYDVEELSLLKMAGASDKVAINPDANAAAPKIDGDSKLEIPETFKVLVIAAPKSKLFAPELTAIESYLQQGGRVVFLAEPNLDAGMSGLLAQYRLKLESDIVVDTNLVNRLKGLGPASPMVFPAGEEHPTAKGMTTPAVFSTVRSITLLPGGEAGVQAEPLFVTGESAWGETNPVDGTASRDDNDHPGPVTVVAVASKATLQNNPSKLSGEGRLVVFGDSDFVSNEFISQGANADLFLNTLSWLAEEGEKISIRPRTRQASQLFLSVAQLNTLKFLSMDILPVLIVLVGVGIVMLRRQR